jgi:uncharacterized membrane protein YfcA
MDVAGVGYDLWALALGLIAGLACGFLNTAASSGSAVSLPILIMIGLDPASANATNRIPVLIGAVSATWSFHQKKTLLWDLATRVSLPVAIGNVIGAGIAEILPARELGLVITATSDSVVYGWREFALFAGIGVWLGFVVLDGATYLLLALTLVVGLPLVQANAIKNATLVPATLVAMVVFAYHGNVNWTLGAVMGAGSIAGGLLGARLAASPAARIWVFRLLVLVICGELVHLGMHYALGTY